MIQFAIVAYLLAMALPGPLTFGLFTLCLVGSVIKW